MIKWVDTDKTEYMGGRWTFQRKTADRRPADNQIAFWYRIHDFIRAEVSFRSCRFCHRRHGAGNSSHRAWQGLHGADGWETSEVSLAGGHGQQLLHSPLHL
jgi:hypothetical protein